MALAKLRDFDPLNDGTFIAPIAVLEGIGATRAMITTDDGVCQGYAHQDGRLWPGPLVTPNAGKVAADAAVATARAADATKLQTAITAITANVTRVTNQGAGSGTDANRDNWLMALTYLMTRQQ
jgi:hypothetical protein